MKMYSKLEIVREELYILLENLKPSDEKVIKKSHQLDEMIVIVQNEKLKTVN